MYTLATSLLLVAIFGTENAPAAKSPTNEQVTDFSGPLDKEGYVDYQVCLNDRLGKGITPDTNANALLWKVFGPTPEKDRMPAEYFARLGIEEPPAKGEYFIPLHRYLSDHFKLDPEELNGILKQLTPCGKRPWAAKEHPQLAGWLAANEQPLALAIEATRRPHYFNPLIKQRGTYFPFVKERPGEPPASITSARRPNIQGSRWIMWALTARAMLRLEGGEFDKSWEDLLACQRLGRLVARGGMVVDLMAGMAFESAASEAAVAFLALSNPADALARLKDLQALPPIQRTYERADLGERIFFLEGLQLFRRDKASAESYLEVLSPKEPGEAEYKGLALIDWRLTGDICNRWFDKMAAALRPTARADRKRELAKLDAELKALGAGDEARIFKLLAETEPPGKLAGEAICLHFIKVALVSGLALDQDRIDRAEQMHQNLRVAFALAAYRHDLGHYPKKLDELAPKYLASVPNDMFADRPLVYRPADDGYLLYSVGVNSKDENGRIIYEDDNWSDDLSVWMPLRKLKPRK